MSLVASNQINSSSAAQEYVYQEYSTCTILKSILNVGILPYVMILNCMMAHQCVRYYRTKDENGLVSHLIDVNVDFKTLNYHEHECITFSLAGGEPIAVYFQTKEMAAKINQFIIVNANVIIAKQLEQNELKRRTRMNMTGNVVTEYKYQEYSTCSLLKAIFSPQMIIYAIIFNCMSTGECVKYFRAKKFEGIITHLKDIKTDFTSVNYRDHECVTFDTAGDGSIAVYFQKKEIASSFHKELSNLISFYHLSVGNKTNPEIVSSIFAPSAGIGRLNDSKTFTQVSR